ncbi:hypothetical protein DAPPUDRAFT_246894 [Daphnia pulex]|uniref:Uncharacterized protein n=1 Tax=Daphnia pulex TaxID=6669 RepID=E9GRE0_DAPPU|nr:hypothetical protein DAPPUDRAFT_246894 [Daphnia pulex]|eukprot:EFX77994.1 hypothetical protein DAPPUDRAFT_246894 [Daphnia pulex]
MENNLTLQSFVNFVIASIFVKQRPVLNIRGRMAWWSLRFRLRQATQFFNSAGRKKCLAPLSVGVPVRVRVSHKWIPGIVQSVCPEPNSYVVLTDSGRLFRRNRQAINVDKFRCRQLLQQEPVVCLRSPPAEAANPVPIRKSLNFLEEWQSALRILPQPPPSHPAAVAIGVTETDDPEDFMEAFHGFEELELNHQPERRRGRPKTWSTHHSVHLVLVLLNIARYRPVVLIGW